MKALRARLLGVQRDRKECRRPFQSSGRSVGATGWPDVWKGVCARRHARFPNGGRAVGSDGPFDARVGGHASGAQTAEIWKARLCGSHRALRVE